MTRADPSRPASGIKRRVRSVVRAARRLRALLALGGRGDIAVDVLIGARARWLSHGTVTIAPNVFIGTDFFVEADLEIGRDVLVSSRVAIVGNDHPFDESDVPITALPRSGSSRVVISGDNLIGHGTIIVGPAVIGHGTVVGAGSLVVGDLPPNSVCVGRPARVIKARR